jgi:hypothetical protein
MKTLARLMIVTAFASLFIATSSASAQSGPGLEASDPHWGSSGTVSVMPHGTTVDRGQATNYPPTAEVSALFRNTGRKAIRSVTWIYVFYKDELRTEVLASNKFRSGRRIEPGASVRLKESVSALSEPKQWTNYHGVVISRIKYTDGTVWQAENDK